MTNENTTPESELQWLALQYISGEMTEAQVAGFEEQLAEDEAACEAVVSAVQMSLAIRQTFETPAEATSPVRGTPAETTVTRPAPSPTTASRGARWLSLVASAAALIIVLAVTQNHQPETMPDNNRELAVLWTQAADVLPVDDVLSGRFSLAFDHQLIVADALEALRSALEETTLATTFQSGPFRISDLRRVYEVVWGTELDPGNFQRKVRQTSGWLADTGQTTAGKGGRPASLFTGPAEVTPLDRPVRRS